MKLMATVFVLAGLLFHPAAVPNANTLASVMVIGCAVIVGYYALWRLQMGIGPHDWLGWLLLAVALVLAEHGISELVDASLVDALRPPSATTWRVASPEEVGFDGSGGWV